jgi:hypothetical protein
LSAAVGNSGISTSVAKQPLLAKLNQFVFRDSSDAKLLDGDGKTADQSCGFLEGLAVPAFEEGGEPLNTFIVTVQDRRIVDLRFNR